MASIGYIVGMVILGLLASFTVLFFMFIFAYAVVLPRFKPAVVETISGYIARFAFSRMPGDGLAAHMDASGIHMKGFEVRDGVIWVDDVPYVSVDEAPVGSALGIPFVATYRNFAGLVNMGLAKVGEEIERFSYESRSETAVADGGAVTHDSFGNVLSALDDAAEDLDDEARRVVLQLKRYLRSKSTEDTDDAKGVSVHIPEHAVVDTSKIQYVDTNASVPDKAARAVKNAEAKAREEYGLTPLKMAFLILGSVGLGAGAVIMALVLIGSVSGSSAGGAGMLISAGVLL